MAHQALARKWRPRTFSQMVGQEHAVRGMRHAVEHGRTHHAYLFTGTRGVGKTTLARILAKALNCTSPQNGEPCNQCPHCTDIDAGRFTDLLEIDAASRTKVEDTRELLENVAYAPNRGRYKIYLIDEVHMLSTHSFNALLKTLEEPPEHVKFLLATTDPQKLPVTVLSRCLQFNLKNLTPEQIRNQMAHILEAEGIPFEPNALRSLARAADGSMRDGLSLLDQAIAHGSGEVREKAVDAMLGTIPRQPVIALLEQVMAGNAAELLQQVENLSEVSTSFTALLQHLMEVLHLLAAGQMVPELIATDDHAERLQALATGIAPEDIQIYYEIAIHGQRDLPYAPDARTAVEMTLLRMLAFRPASSSQQRQPPQTPKAAPRTASPAIPQRQTEAPSTPQAPVRPEPTAAAPPMNDPWHQMVRKMSLKGMVGQLASHCILQEMNDQECLLLLESRFENLKTAAMESQLGKSLNQLCGKPIKLRIQLSEAPSPETLTPARRDAMAREERQRAAERDINTDATVQLLKSELGANIIPGSIRPINTQTEDSQE